MWSDWLVFILSALWWRRIRGLWKLPDGRDWLRGKLGLVLKGRAMLSKSLIQFSVDGWSCVPSLLFTWSQTMVEVTKIMATSFKRSYACTCSTLPPTLQQATTDPRLRWRLLDIPGQVWVSLLWVTAPFSWVLVHKVLFVPSKSISQPCVRGLMFVTHL